MTRYRTPIPLDWSDAMGCRCRIYRSLSNGLMSVQLRRPSPANGRLGWRVCGHIDNLVLIDIHFHVNLKGVARVRQEGKKDVIAYAEGKLIGPDPSSSDCPVDLAFNPFRDNSFVERGTLCPIRDCQLLVVINNKVFVSPDALKPNTAGGN